MILLTGGGVHCCSGGHAWLLLGGRAWFFLGGMCGFFQEVCMVFSRGHAWFLPGGHTWFLLGGPAWFFPGGGHAWFLPGGVRGFFRGACVVFPGGACIGYDEIRSMSGRYASYWNAFLFLENLTKMYVGAPTGRLASPPKDNPGSVSVYGRVVYEVISQR